MNYVDVDPSKLTIMKFKNINLTKEGALEERENYRMLMRHLAYLTEDNKEKVFMLFDADKHAIPSVSVGFDIVSTNMTGLDGDGGFGAQPGGFGGWYDKKQLWSIKFKDVEKLATNNGGLPCSCPACTEINEIGIKTIEKDRWNKLRREHYVYIMNEIMTYVASLTTLRNIEEIRMTLLNSEISKLSRLIPRF